MDQELGSLVRKLLIVALTALATKLHMSDVSWVLPVATDLADLGVIAWGIYAHRGMVKVPAVKAVLFALAVLGAAAIPGGGSGGAHASDLPPPARAINKAIEQKLTAIYDWSGFYAAVGIGGAATKGRVDLYTLPEVSNINPAGLMLGGKIGARKQFGNAVAGLELGGFWNNERGSVKIGDIDAKLGNSWFAHITPHVGFTADQAIAKAGKVFPNAPSITAPQPSVLFWLGPDLALRDAKIDLSDNTHADVVRVGYGVRGGIDVPISNLFFGAEVGWDRFNKFDCIPGFSCPTGLQVKFTEWEGLIRAGVRF